MSTFSAGKCVVFSVSQACIIRTVSAVIAYAAKGQPGRLPYIILTIGFGIAFQNLPWILYDYFNASYQVVLAFIATTAISIISSVAVDCYFVRQSNSKATWKVSILMMVSFSTLSWVTFVVIVSVYYLGHQAISINTDQALSLSAVTVIYIGLVYPITQGVLMYLFRGMPFWKGVRRRIRALGGTDLDLLTNELRFHYLYDIMFGIPGKVLVLRISHLPTFFVSLLTATLIRLLSRYSNSIFISRRVRKNITSTANMPSYPNGDHNLAKVTPITDEQDDSNNLPNYNSTNKNELKTISQTEAEVQVEIAEHTVNGSHSEISAGSNHSTFESDESLIRKTKEAQEIEIEDKSEALGQLSSQFLSTTSPERKNSDDDQRLAIFEKAVKVLTVPHETIEAAGLEAIAIVSAVVAYAAKGRFLYSFSAIVFGGIFQNLPWIVYDYFQASYQVVLAFTATSILSTISSVVLDCLLVRKSYSKAACKISTIMMLSFGTLSWITYFVMVIVYYLGHQAIAIDTDQALSMSAMTVVYIGLVYPVTQGVLMYLFRGTPFWEGVRRRIKTLGGTDLDLLTNEISFHYISDIMFGIPGKVLVLRISHLPTLLTATMIRLLSRYSNSIFISRRVRKSKNPTTNMFSSSNVDRVTAKIIPIIDDQDDENNLPHYNSTNQDQIKNTETEAESQLEVEDHYGGQSHSEISPEKSNHITDESDDSLFRRDKEVQIEIEDNNGTLGQQSSQTLSKTQQEVETPDDEQKLTIFEKAVKVITVPHETIEAVGLEGMAYMTSDFLLKLSAIVFIFIMLGYDASWSSCFGSIDLSKTAIKAVVLVLSSIAIEVPYTLWERGHVGYNLDEVVGTLSRVEVGWGQAVMMLLSALFCLTCFMSVEAGVFQHNPCFDKG
ncbi:hypothetical protein HDU76_000401 [Blyttiomyces sp. JEL0837]|nr:hypothetical protein HDU76_000401 [Blyttiomyces sp. JEL0837]